MEYKNKEDMQVFEVQPTYTLRITEEDIDDIMASALDSGISYWCEKVEVVGGKYLGEYASDQIAKGGELKFYIKEFVNGEDTFVMTRDDFLRGVKLYMELPVSEYYNARTENGGIDVARFDAIAADCIVQLALFDEIVYG